MTTPTLAYYYSGNYYDLNELGELVLVQNSDPDRSLGGQMSSVEIPIQAASFATTTITGVTIVGAVGITIPTGKTSYLGKGYLNASTRQLSFQVGTGTILWPAVNITTGGRYYLQDRVGAAGRYLVVDCNWSIIGTTSELNRVVNITSAQPVNVIFNNSTGADSAVGATDYRCIYVKNTGTVTVTATLTVASVNELAKVWFGVESTTPNTYGTQIADRFDSLGALTVLEWISSTGSLAVTLAAGQFLPVWFKRRLPNLNQINGTQAVNFSVTTV